MTNVKAVRTLCTAMVSMFYPDIASAELCLVNVGLDPLAESTPKDPLVFQAALSLVMGFVESSRSEGGVSASLRSDSVLRRSLTYWCRQYGLDPDEELKDFGTSIRNRSDMW